ncbi:bifunctional phosphopantothenoylcysteine decarboxylase/phosphopantothenate synthase [Proteiniborus sp. DW1]|jgi:phosphopantothenoylcysteine decarboxylase/phosphopantothenate--cysteine ligase|uniref:bifunctional phosphopantothenoylcysteine decarboxylase/phosphopantothenate--cysteine ligase CoaBC n=1 Tax=Proteiniborus sp. DW1 TaxID=1889883 RepID=UPI00092E09D7|nr:bifunctional phosphopantothenoylcysteine decarboxylase/phosphopantothenate--cysteine ligase CoaBC [Proteiniborus sp. DW1]SCG83513.1 bifunctional phosphopantothenoylcysteine decarboxylase/phosphopantothenate synthase [Proteiniborus sp. DW1]
MFSGKNIVMGVTGGIAVYKAVDVVSRLKKLNANVDVIMTKSATEFVTPLTFQSISQNPVTVDMFNEPKQWDIQHISLAKKADLFIIAPATANIIGKVANGIADDMLSTTIMATRAKVVFAPAMNTNMYNNVIFKENMNKLKSLGYEFINPGSGRLACGDIGEGKMAEPIDIIDYLTNLFANNQLKGKKFIITAGPTIEPLDPVRYMTNYSSGKMGFALAKVAQQRGAEVILITGPVNLEPPIGVKLIKVNTTREMLNAIEKHFDDCQVLIKAAAPLDYRPVTVSGHKIKKEKDEIEFKFIKNPDIAAHFGKIKKNQIIVGFAAETENIIDNALKKIDKKNLDFIVANNVLTENAGFKSDNNIVTIIDKNGAKADYPMMKKEDVAKVIIDKVIEMLNC